MCETEFEDDPEDIRRVAYLLKSLNLNLRTRHWDTHQDTKHWDRMLRDVDTIRGTLQKYRNEVET